jgi:hypothetical protein
MSPGADRSEAPLARSALLVMVVIMMMVVMVMMPPARPDHDAWAAVMVMVVMVRLRELDLAVPRNGGLLLVHGVQQHVRIGDRLEQIGIGADAKHVSRVRRGRGLRRTDRSERGHRSQKSGHLFFQENSPRL